MKSIRYGDAAISTVMSFQSMVVADLLRPMRSITVIAVFC